MKTKHIHDWDCRPSARRTLPDPSKAERFRQRLQVIQDRKLARADEDIQTASSAKERAAAVEKKEILMQYGI